MPNYKYRVIYENGKIGRGRIMGLNKTQIIDTLKNEGLQPIMVKKISKPQKKFKRLDYKKINKEKRQNKFPTNKARRPKKKLEINNLNDLKGVEFDFSLFKRTTTKDLIIFSNNFYILKKARFNNVQALQTIYDGTENEKFKDIVEDILIGVEAGQRLYAVMDEYPKTFPSMYVNFIRVGEESGTLDVALLYARDFIESSVKLRKKVKSAVIPRILQVVAIMIMLVVCLLVGVPILEDVYSSFGSTEQVPPATMWGLNAVKWCISNWYIIIRSKCSNNNPISIIYWNA